MVNDTPEELAEVAAEAILESIDGALKQRGVARVALSGGKTPVETYRALSRRRRHFEGVRWFWVDERCVPPGSSRSNYGMALRALLQPAAVHPSRVFRMEGEIEPSVGARRYADVLRREFCATDSPPGSGVDPADVRFDVVIAGCGSDGHTGSLFPGTGAVKLVDDLVTVVNPGRDREERLTLTRPVLLSARRVIVLAVGERKRRVVEVARSFGSEDEVPARIYLAAPPGIVSWMMDRQAAGPVVA